MESDRKRRILFIGEANFLATGFSTYWHEVLKRLHETNEFEIAELGCIPNPYSLIQMGDGSLKPISLIQVGDNVVTHTGQSKRVTRIFKRETQEKVIEIQREFFAGKSLRVTGNHQILVIPHEKAYLYDDPKRGSWDKNAIIQWIKASDIRPQDLVAYSIMKNFKHDKTTIKRYGLSIPLNDDLAFLAGWFLAEGYIGHHKKLGDNHFGVCASLKEEKHIKRFCDCLYRLFNIKTDYRKRADIGVYEVKVHNRIVTQFLQSLLGSSCYSKFIDPELFSGSQDFLLKLIGAYAEGDGCSSTSRNDIVVKTASKQLGLDIIRILLNLGIRCSLNKQKGIGYRLTIAGQYARKLATHFIYKNQNFNNLRREETLQIDNLMFMKVTQIHRSDYTGTVYNLEVDEDDSYICDNYVVHNSYAHDDDPRCQQVLWKFYPVAPARSNQQAIQRYMANPTSQFGEWRFDDVCLDFKPDIVCAIRDWWMDEFVLRSPFRKNFSFIWMPTIDGEPQREL
ncbi:MAG: LAGLIDADG family homing endonuclease, partial [Nitrosopumilus sp.]